MILVIGSHFFCFLESNHVLGCGVCSIRYAPQPLRYLCSQRLLRSSLSGYRVSLIKAQSGLRLAVEPGPRIYSMGFLLKG